MTNYLKRYKTIAFTIIWLASIFLFHLQDRLAIPNIDDWAYTLIVSPEDYNGYLTEVPVRQPVKSLSDALYSQQNDYIMTNGRFLIHVLVQYFCGTMSRQQFSWLNSAVFGLFLLLVFRFVKPKKDLWLAVTFVSVLWLLLPYQGFVLMGPVSLCVNYLWTLTATLLLLLLFRHLVHRRVSLPFLTVLSLFAFITGSLQESFSIGISAAMLVYIVSKWHQLNRQIIVFALAYLAGALICLLSPANFQRTESVSGVGLHLNAVFGLLSSPPFLLLAAYMTWMTVKHRIKEFLYQHLFLITAMTVALLFAVFLAYTARHQLTIINVFSLIILLSCWTSYASEKKTLKRVTAIAFTVATIILYIQILSIRTNWHNAYLAFEQRCRHSTDGTVDGGTFETMANSLMYNRIYNNYATIFTFIGWDYGKQMFSMYLTEGKSNKQITDVLPYSKEELAQQCCTSPEVKPSLYFLKDGYYLLRADSCLSKDNVLLVGSLESGFTYQSSHEGVFKANETFYFNGYYYYLFNNKPRIVHVDSIYFTRASDVLSPLCHESVSSCRRAANGTQKHEAIRLSTML